MVTQTQQISATQEQKRQFSHSVSAANTFRQCSRLYYNKYVLGWLEAGEASWLTFGTKIDQLLETIDLGGLQAGIAAIPSHFTSPFDQMDAEVLLRHFHAKYGHQNLPPVDYQGKPGNQYPFRINFQGNEVTGFLSMQVSGKIDKVTLVEGDISVMEGKTTGEAIEEHSHYWKRLEMDPQIACYAWALSREFGRPINWVWYQVIRRPTSAAHPLFNKTYTRGGKVIPFTEAEYQARVFSILKTNPQKALCARRKVYITEERKALWVTEHAQNFLDIQGRKEKQALLEEQGLPPEQAWPRNHYGCDMYGGCPFFDACVGKQSIEGTGKFVKRRDMR